MYLILTSRIKGRERENRRAWVADLPLEVCIGSPGGMDLWCVELGRTALEQVELSCVCRSVTWGPGGCGDNRLHSNWRNAFTHTCYCVGMDCSMQPSGAHLPAFQVEGQNSFIILVRIAALPGFCTAIQKGWVSCLVKIFPDTAPRCGCFKKGLSADCVPIVITLKCCTGEGGEAIFSCLVISLFPWIMTVNTFGHFSLARVILDTILIPPNV